MEKFEVYDREQQSWSDNKVVLMPGWNENWVQDKTTDTATIKVKYKGSYAPSWKSGDWCRLLHLQNESDVATYTHKTETINVTEDYYLTELIKREYNPETKIFTATFDTDKIGDGKYNNYSLGIVFQFYADVNGTKVLQTKSYVYSESTQSVTYDLGDAFSSYNDYRILPEEFGMLFVYLLIFQFTERPITYTYTKNISYYVPNNHEQFIIGNITKVYDKMNDEWDIQLSLLEPIKITEGIVCETRSFSNQSFKTIDNVEYKHEAKNHLNILEDLLRTTPTNNDINNSWYSRIKISNLDWLKSQPYNNDTFSEARIYDVLLNKYDSSLGRTPVIYFDINGETDKPFNTERTEYVLEFLRQDGFDKSDITLSELSSNASKLQISESWENKGDGIVSNVSNLSPSSKIKYVSEYLWAVPEIDSAERNVSGYGSNSTKGIWVLKTPFPIKRIEKITKYETHTELHQELIAGVINYYSYLTTATTDYYDDEILEKKQYEADDTLYDTRNVMWYEEGKNVIHLNNYYYKADYGDFFRIEYEPIINFRYDDGEDFETIINQVDGQVGENRYSKYLKNYIKSMNKSDIIIAKTVNNWSDIVDVGTRVIDGDKTYLITNVGISNRGFDYDVVYQLNENHFRKSDAVISSQEVRKNTAISYENLTDRKSAKISKYKITFNEDDNLIDNVDDYIDRRYLLKAITNQNVSGLKPPQLALIRFKSILTNNSDDSKQLVTNSRLCNGAISVINNTICFNLKYENNAICGTKKVLHEHQVVPSTVANRPPAIKTSPEQQVPILYTDGFGEIDKFDIYLINVYNEQLGDYANNQSATSHDLIDKVNAYIDATTNYPLTTGLNDNVVTRCSKMSNINYKKDMLDIFNYTIGFKFESDAQIILCDAFFRNSGLLQNKGIQIVRGFTTNKQENDEFVGQWHGVTSTLNNNEITIDCGNAFTSWQTPPKCIAFFRDDVPVMIVNDVDKLDATVWNGQILKLYCNKIK